MLGQESCDRILIPNSFGEIVPFKLSGSMKDLYLKTLQKRVFCGYGGRYTKDNTLVIDDSPMKHCLNLEQNVIFPKPWTYKGEGCRDTFLMHELCPWLERLHQSADRSVKCCLDKFSLGQQMLADDPFDLLYADIMEAIDKSERLGFKYRSSF